MKKSVKVEEIPANECGLLGLLDEHVMLICARYFVSGKLIGVNDKFVMLEKGAKIVYDTGKWESKTFQLAEAPGDDVYVMIGAIESFFKTEKR